MLELQQYLPFTVLKRSITCCNNFFIRVATVLTVYGIETPVLQINRLLPLLLQQYLPFTVLKHSCVLASPKEYHICCNSTYRLRY